MTNAPNAPRGCGCLITAVGVLLSVILLTIAAVWGFRSYQVESTWIKTSGSVVDLVSNETDDDTFAPIVEYRAADGTLRRFEHNVFSNTVRIGENVDVLYDPADPDQAVVHSAAGFWLGPAIFATIGTTVLVVTLIVGFAVRRRSTRDNSARSGDERTSGRARRPAEYRRVETRIDSDGTFHWQIVAKAEDGLEYRSDWFDEDPQMDLMRNSYAVSVEQRGYDWIVVPD